MLNNLVCPLQWRIDIAMLAVMSVGLVADQAAKHGWAFGLLKKSNPADSLWRIPYLDTASEILFSDETQIEIRRQEDSLFIKTTVKRINPSNLA